MIGSRKRSVSDLKRVGWVGRWVGSGGGGVMWEKGDAVGHGE